MAVAPPAAAAATEPLPTARELTPVELVAAQVPVNPLTVDAHCAKAGATPNTVTIPAATARPRKAPPASALAPRRRACRPPAFSIGLQAIATWSTRGLIRRAIRPCMRMLAFVFISAPLLSQMTLPLRPAQQPECNIPHRLGG
jgi:hypothetical protein